MKLINVCGKMIELTPARKQRITDEIKDCTRRINKEMGYSEGLRNTAEIERIQAHVAHLETMIAE